MSSCRMDVCDTWTLDEFDLVAPKKMPVAPSPSIITPRKRAFREVAAGTGNSCITTPKKAAPASRTKATLTKVMSTPTKLMSAAAEVTPATASKPTTATSTKPHTVTKVTSAIATSPPSAKRPESKATTAIPVRRASARRQLPRGDPERLHMQNCKIRQCQRCLFGRQKRKWIARLPLVPKEVRLEWEALPLDKRVLAEGSWAHWDGDAVACMACSDTKIAPRIADLSRHHMTTRHRAKVMSFLAVETSPSGFPLAGSPPAKEFLQVWDSLCDKNSPRHGVHGVCDARKAARMMWCIAEGMKTLDRKALQKAKVICMMRDERHQRLPIRFRCLDREGRRVRKGLLWQSKKFGAGAVNITIATREAIRKFSTRNFGAPRDWAGSAVKVKHLASVDANIRESTRALCVDAASDELLSARLMVGSAVDDLLPVTPNLKLVTRDNTHAARRVVTRPQSADPFLTEVHKRFVFNKTAIAQKIEHSHVFKSIFEEAVSRQSGDLPMGIRIKRLRAAKHRHASFATPVARLVVHSTP